MAENILDTILIKGNEHTEDWTIRHAVEGIQIFGGIGSGKSSGSGAFFARKYLKQGFGGLVLTVKIDEKDNWIKYCEETGRLDDLFIVEPNSEYRFNFLAYENSRADAGRGITANIAQIFKTVIDAEKTISQGKTSNDPFWNDALDMFLINIIDLCLLSNKGELSFDSIYQMSSSLPNSLNQLKDKDFRKTSEFAQALMVKIASKRELGDLSESDFQLYQKVENYFMNKHIPLSEKTRSIIEYSLDGLLFQLSRNPIYSMFCSGDSSFTPEDSINGKIILLNLPVKIYDKVGRDIQIMFKYIWQRAMERRQVDNDTKPVFLWADEAQNFIHEHDIDYQATARSARVCTVYLTQNLPNYFAHMGGDAGKYHVKSFLGTLGTKIFHANSDMDTNYYASELFGKRFIEIDTSQYSLGEKFSKTLHPQLQNQPYLTPESFVKLKTGTELNQKIVEGVVHLQRRTIKKNNYYRPFFIIEFTQQ